MKDRMAKFLVLVIQVLAVTGLLTVGRAFSWEGQQQKQESVSVPQLLLVASLAKKQSKPDIGRACETMGKAIRMVKDARAPVGSNSLYQQLQQNLRPLLGEIGGNIGKNSAARKQLDDVQKNLDSLKFVSAQSNLQNNLRLLRMEDGLRELTYISCDVSRPRATKSGAIACPAGEKAKAPGDDEAANYFKEKSKEAIKQLKDEAKAAREGQGRTRARDLEIHLEAINGKIAKAQQGLAVWNRITDPSLRCLPVEVIQGMRQVADDRRGSGHSNNCPPMCDALARWYEKLLNKERSFERKLFMNQCGGDCN